MDSECNIRLSESQEVQKWEKRLASFKTFLHRFSKTETKEASKHLFQKQYASQQFHSQDYSQSYLATEKIFDQSASIFTIDLEFDADLSKKQELPETHLLKKRMHRKKASTISRGSRDFTDLIVTNTSIYSKYRVIKLIHRFRSRQLFIIQPKEGMEKMMMRVSFKIEFRDKQAVRGGTEIANFTLMDHPAFPKLKQVYEECNKYILIFQHREGVTLAQFMLLYEISEELARIILKQLLQILQYLHTLQIVHRDIRPENIFVTNYHEDINQLQIQLIDMSLSISQETIKRDRETLTGLSFYASPESKKGFISHKYDIWSLGILSIVLLLCQFQQMEDDSELLLQSIANRSDLFVQHSKKIPKKAAEFINYLLTSKHTYRPSATQALKHSWINKSPQVSVHSFRSHRKVDLEPFIPTLFE